MEPIRLGVVGTGRGKTFMHPQACTGFKLCAICDRNQEKLDLCKKAYDTDGTLLTFTDFDEMINSGAIDAVVLANYFNEHAPFAIKALKAGIHVMSECAAINTLAEGVELCRTVEETGKIYMIAENYPYSKPRLEMKRVYESGEIGQIQFGKGEYCHAMQNPETYRISPGECHWRNLIPATYYCTHAIAPIMHITNTMPVRVNGFVGQLKDQSYRGLEYRHMDPGGMIVCQMDNGAVVNTLQGAVKVHSGITEIYGTKGGMSIDRESGNVTVWHENVDKGDKPNMRTYTPDWPEYGDLASQAGHGGGDFWTLFYFGKAIQENKQPWLNVYRACAMSCIGILAWKSVLDGGRSYDVPQWDNEEDRKKYENDNWTPFYKEGDDLTGKPPSAVSWVPSEEAHQAAKAVWEARHYWGLGWDGKTIDDNYAKVKV